MSLALAVVSPFATSAWAADSTSPEKTGPKIIALDENTGQDAELVMALTDGTTFLQRGTPTDEKLTAVNNTTKQENARYRATRS
ncbi:MAG: hypothetical protein AAF234_07745 [Pseudomonadota bacterium]